MSFTSIVKKMSGQLLDFTPYPSADLRDGWKQLPGELRSALVRSAEPYADYTFAPLPATLYMEFSRSGDRARFEKPYFSRRAVLNTLVLAECAEYAGRFTDRIIDGVYALCEESGWQLPAHNSYIRDTPQLPLPDDTRPVLDLFACETGCQLAMIHYLLHEEFDAVSPGICRRIETGLDRRIFTPYLNETFWWMGYNRERTNNWTSWCTQNVLIAAFLPGVLCGRRSVHSLRRRILTRAAYSLDRFLSSYGADGCCDEGAQYYRHAGLCLSTAMDVIDAAGGGGCCRELSGKTKIRNIAEYIVNVHAADRYYINFADCAAAAGRSGVREFLFGKRCGSRTLMSYAAEDWKAAGQQGTQDPSDAVNLFYRVQELFTAVEIASFSTERIPPVSDCSYRSTGLYISRDESRCLAVKAGGNDDSHNHNDTGSFILYKNGLPFIIDIGVETYSRKTFSPQRYEIWTMQSLYHNVTNFSPFMQQAGAAYRAECVRYRHSHRIMSISMELQHAYPAGSGIERYTRSVVFEKEKRVTVTDTIAGSYKEAVFTLLTRNVPVVSGNGTNPSITVVGTGTIHLKSPSDVHITIEPISVTDPRLLESWPDTLYRILISYRDRITAVFQ